MRASLLSLICVALVPGCLGNGNAITGPMTIGDSGHTEWQINDGLCGAGLFGNQCDLNVHVATGAAPLVTVRARSGTSLAGATLMGGSGVTITHVVMTTTDQTTGLDANVQRTSAGTADVIVLDASGHEIDRAHLTFVDTAALVCGNVSGHERDLDFAGLANGPVTITEQPADGGSTLTTTILGCRANDASGHALLSVDAINWSIAPGATGTVSIASDDLLASTPAHGATARLLTSGSGSASVVASIGSVSQSTAVTFH